MQKRLNRVQTDAHLVRYLLVAESLQQECHGLLLSMGKVELLRDLGQNKTSGRLSLQHKQSRGVGPSFAITLQKVRPAKISSEDSE